MLKKNQRGIVLLEFAIYFPVALVLFAGFIVTAMVLTQRVVLDRAVARATQEGAMWLSTTMRFTEGARDPFADRPVGIRTNPYARFLTGGYGPASESSFHNELKKRVSEYANTGIIVRNTNIKIETNYQYFVVAGDLIVTVSADVNTPIVPAFARWRVYSSASARVMRPASLMNDVSFIFDTVRHLTGFDVNVIGQHVGNFPHTVNNLLQISERFNQE